MGFNGPRIEEKKSRFAASGSPDRSAARFPADGQDRPHMSRAPCPPIRLFWFPDLQSSPEGPCVPVLSQRSSLSAALRLPTPVPLSKGFFSLFYENGPSFQAS